ncbi:unnamed protein product [Paramecium sonneborni]|uniref:Uncharacterized protein n=1 Tax=Paramecium sonneborni TaxID=65129 RepID=A0A8S1RQH2_9CILI|nr:unnamed protein product [Paramecium sonneborni]
MIFSSYSLMALLIKFKNNFVQQSLNPCHKIKINCQLGSLKFLFIRRKHESSQKQGFLRNLYQIIFNYYLSNSLKMLKIHSLFKKNRLAGEQEIII